MLIEITPEESKLLLEIVGSSEYFEGINDLYDKLDYQINTPRRS